MYSLICLLHSIGAWALSGMSHLYNMKMRPGA